VRTSLGVVATIVAGVIAVAALRSPSSATPTIASPAYPAMMRSSSPLRPQRPRDPAAAYLGRVIAAMTSSSLRLSTRLFA
jgi:hypothetical protein